MGTDVRRSDVFQRTLELNNDLFQRTVEFNASSDDYQLSPAELDFERKYEAMRKSKPSWDSDSETEGKYSETDWKEYSIKNQRKPISRLPSDTPVFGAPAAILQSTLGDTGEQVRGAVPVGIFTD